MNGKMVGDLLREARLTKQLQLMDIENMTGIAVQHLLALELDQFGLVPEGQVEPYLKSYADVVGLNVDDIYNQYIKQSSFQNSLSQFKVNEKSNLATIEVKEEILERRAHRRRRSHREPEKKKSIFPSLIISILVLAIIAVVGYLVVKEWPLTKFIKEASKETTVTTTETTVTEASSIIKMETQEDGSSLATVQTDKEIVDVVFTINEGESWVSLNDGVTEELGTILTTDQKMFTVSVDKGSSSLITIGMPKSSSVTVDGQEIDLTEVVNFSPATFTLKVE